jgi:hypothetical protein
MVGPNWPNEGEIDIIEGVNLNTYDQVTLHTSSGCVPTIGSGGQTGTPTGNADCGAGGGYTGCGVVSGSTTSYGTAFDANGGGVYATLWTSSAIKVWYFPANGIPSDIKSGTPNPAGWGTPIANYAGCDFDAHFQNMNIVSFCPSIHQKEMRVEANTNHDRFLTLHSVVTGQARFGAHLHVHQSIQAATHMLPKSHSRLEMRIGW